MCCDDYPGAVVVTAPSNKRLKLSAPPCCGGHPFVNVPASRRSLAHAVGCNRLAAKRSALLRARSWCTGSYS